MSINPMQKDLAPDIELNLKKKARRRLVGAIALVLVLVTLLPFLLKDRSINVSNDNVEISLEGNETPVYTLPDETQLPNDFDSSVVPANQPEVADKTIELPLPAEKTTTAEPVEKKTVDKPEPVKVTKKDPVKKPIKPVVKDKVVNTPIVKPVEKTEPKKEAVAKKGSFIVQIGAFSDPEKVKALQTKMRELGYASSTEKVTTEKGVLIRLKSHTFSSRNEAVIALENMKDAGLSGMVRTK